MKIAHVQVIPQLSGAQQISLDLLSSLNDGSNDLYMICGEIQEFSFDFLEKLNDIGVTIVEVPNLKRELGKHDIYAYIELYRIFKKFNFDIIHTNSTKPAVLARIAARMSGCKKIIHTVHGIAFHKHIPVLRRFLYYFAELFSVYFGHENISVNKYYNKFYPLAKTKTIYNGVDFSKFIVEKSRALDGLNFAFFARLDEQKNPLEFIQAIHLLNTEGVLDIHKDVIFTLAGDGELKSECCKLIKIYGLDSKINVIGWVTDKNKFLNTIDVLCQPSKWEAFGLTFVESAYFGVPAIATKVEGIPEVVLNGYTGLLYDGGAEGLKECMKQFISNRRLVPELGKMARKRALEMFSKQNMVKNYHEIYFEK